MSPTIPQTHPRLNHLLRGEMSAVETYEQAIKSLSMDEDLPLLQNLLRDHILAHGTLPADSSGVWGSWAAVVEGTAVMLGKATAIRALRAGEEHGVHDYVRALGHDDLSLVCKEMIAATLLPLAQAHCRILDGIIQSS